MMITGSRGLHRDTIDITISKKVNTAYFLSAAGGRATGGILYLFALAMR
jgi:hypothetical protein